MFDNNKDIVPWIQIVELGQHVDANESAREDARNLIILQDTPVCSTACVFSVPTCSY